MIDNTLFAEDYGMYMTDIVGNIEAEFIHMSVNELVVSNENILQTLRKSFEWVIGKIKAFIAWLFNSGGSKENVKGYYDIKKITLDELVKKLSGSELTLVQEYMKLRGNAGDAEYDPIDVNNDNLIKLRNIASKVPNDMKIGKIPDHVKHRLNESFTRVGNKYPDVLIREIDNVNKYVFAYFIINLEKRGKLFNDVMKNAKGKNAKAIRDDLAKYLKDAGSDKDEKKTWLGAGFFTVVRKGSMPPFILHTASPTDKKGSVDETKISVNSYVDLSKAILEFDKFLLDKLAGWKKYIDGVTDKYSFENFDTLMRGSEPISFDGLTDAVDPAMFIKNPLHFFALKDSASFSAIKNENDKLKTFAMNGMLFLIESYIHSLKEKHA